MRFTDGLTLGLKKKLFASCNGLKKNRVGRLVKKKLGIFFWSKMCVSCMFFVDWELGGRKKLKGRDFFE